MRFKLDPTSPSGLSIMADAVIQNRQSPGYIGEVKISGLLTAGANITLTGNGTLQSPYILAAGGSGSGVTRTITSVTTTVTGAATASTDYVYLLGSGAVYTQPTAVSNTNLYTLKNITTGNLTIGSTSAQTFDGGTLVLGPSQSVDLISDNSNWRII